ncbi:glycosyltransferase family 4 protein [Vibrio jasicida]|uniref:Glycosyltransferase family 4 protein n=1 Tax=Vibrio jasicida TaxID=766224 RepID=A0ABW7J815_9VIBR
MKIIYIHQYFKKPTMSGGVRSYEFAKRLVKDGHEVVIVTSDTEEYFSGWKNEEIEGIEVHWKSVKYNNKFGFLSRVWAFYSFLLHATLHVISIKSDIIIATSTPLTVSIPAIVYKFVYRVPFIFEVRDVWPEIPIALGFLRNRLVISAAKLLERISYNAASHIIALSPDMKNSIETITKTKVTVVPNAADIELFEGRCLESFSDKELLKKINVIRSKHKKVLFYTGTFGMVNNLSYLIDLAGFSQGDIAFVFVGDGIEKDLIIEKSKERNLIDSVVYFFSPIPKDKLWVLHNSFDMAVSTVLPIKPLYSNSANKVFDAFAAGSPILINHSGWLQEIIEKNVCGIVLGEKPSFGEYTRLTDFLFDEEKIVLARKNAKKLGESDFNRDTLYLKFIEGINK